MFANISRKAQKAKLSALSKEAFLEEIMTAAPRDYQDRNWFYHLASHLIGYPLQLVSVLAGSYLLYEIAVFVWQIESFSNTSYIFFGGCFAIFLLIEMLRRWLIDTTGYHYLATYQVEGQRLTAGEYLRTKIYVLALISIVLVTSGTIGAYQYSKNHAPQAKTINVKQEVSPLSKQIEGEKQHIAQLDKSITALQQNKAAELRDHKSYAVWAGKEYLLPETKTRHEGYDKQIASMQNQRQKHLDLIQKYEQKLFSQEQKYEQKNAQITSTNESHKEMYAAACAGIWLIFEMLLLLMLSYPWVYKVGIKREKLLESVEIKRRIHLKAQAQTQEKIVSKPASATVESKEKKTAFPPIFENRLEEDTLPTYEDDLHKSPIGFEKWYEKEPKSEVKPTITEVIIERKVEVPTEVIVTKEITSEGYEVICAHCGKHEIKKRPAKYCSNTCRKKHWQAQQELMG
jgi:hypothetical protein